MKINAVLAFFFFFALFAFSRAEYVRDSDGHLIPNGGTYHLMIQEGQDAAITDAIIKNPEGSCSLGVVKLYHTYGIPVRIESTSLHTNYITTESPIQISFNPLPSNKCTKHPWWLVNHDKDFEQNAVMVGDPSEFSDPVSGKFYFKTIDNAKHHYGFVFCVEQHICEDVAIKTDGFQNMRLIVNKRRETVGSLVFKLVQNPSNDVAAPRMCVAT